MNNIEQIVRQLAKSSYYQTLYRQCKEVRIRLFRNETDLTRFQLLFLHYLTFYSSIMTDIALGEVPQDVLEKTIYEDAYMYWKGKNYLTKEPQKSPIVPEAGKGNSTWIFPSKKKNG